RWLEEVFDRNPPMAMMCDHDAVYGDLLERLATATHEVYRGTVGDYENKPAHADAAYGDLPDDLKESNRAFIRSIFAKLDGIGYTLMPARSGDPPVEFPGEHEEALAEAEHERWMWERLGQGYRYGEQSDKERLINENLIPWAALSDAEMRARYGKYADRIGPGPMTDEQKQWDRDMVTSIPKLLAEAGYTLVRLGDTDTTDGPEDEA
ncbi:MAG: RyR domain-containing protein, partial [Armatimonadota bacterium]